jgi:hypothetical protein
MKTTRMMYWAGLTLLLIIWVASCAYQFTWHKGIESQVSALGDAVSQSPDRFKDIRIGDRDILLFHKNLTINCDILGLAMRTSVATSAGIILLLAGTVLVVRNRKQRRNAQPPGSRDGVPAAPGP